MGSRAGCDLLNLVLAENVRTEYLIAIKGNGDGRSYLVEHLNSVVSTPASGIFHVRLGSEFDVEASVSQIRLDQTVDHTVPLQIRLGVWHKAKAEAKKFKRSCLSCPSAADQAVQPIGELQLHTG